MPDDVDSTREDAIHALKRRFQDLNRWINKRVHDDGLVADGLPCLDDCIDAVEALVKWYEVQTPNDLPIHGNAHHIYYIGHAIDGIRDWTATFLSREFANELDEQLDEITKMGDELDRTVIKASMVKESEHRCVSKPRAFPDEDYDSINDQMAIFLSGLSHLATRLRRLRKWAERSRDPKYSKPDTPHAITTSGPSVVSAGSKLSAGEGQWAPGAKEKLEKGLEEDRKKRQQQWKEWLQQRIQLEGEIEEARQAGDVSTLLSKLAEGIASWAVAIKNGLFDYFDDTDDGRFSRRMSSSEGPLRPAFILWPFSGANEAYDVIELTVGEDQARALGRRINDLEKLRRQFADAVSELGSKWDEVKNYGAFADLDEHRSWLKGAAFDVSRYIESLIRLIDSGKVGSSAANPHTEKIEQVKQGMEAFYERQRQYEEGLERVSRAVQSITPLSETMKQAYLDAMTEHEQQKVKHLPGPKSAGEKQAEWLAKAMLIVREHPDWPDAEIARRVGKNPGTLSRSREYKTAAQLARGSKEDLPKGYITMEPDSGPQGIEAVAPPTAPPDDRSDRGKLIPGSRYFREYCADCGEPMKVTKDKVEKKPLCDHCAE